MELSEKDMEQIEKMKVKYEEGRNERGGLEWSRMEGYFRDDGDMSVGIRGSVLQYDIRSDTANEEDMKFIKWLIKRAICEWVVGRIHDELEDEQEMKDAEEVYGDG